MQRKRGEERRREIVSVARRDRRVEVPADQAQRPLAVARAITAMLTTAPAVATNPPPGTGLLRAAAGC